MLFSRRAVFKILAVKAISVVAGCLGATGLIMDFSLMFGSFTVNFSGFQVLKHLSSDINLLLTCSHDVNMFWGFLKLNFSCFFSV